MVRARFGIGVAEKRDGARPDRDTRVLHMLTLMIEQLSSRKRREDLENRGPCLEEAVLARSN